MDYFKNLDLLSNEVCGPSISGTQYRIVTDYASELVSLDFFKCHARIDFDTDNSLVQSYLEAARVHLEQWSQLSFGIRTMGFKAIQVPNNYKLMFGPVDTVTGTDYTNFGDNLRPGGEDVDIEYTTLGFDDENIRIAICRYATGLYVFRENVVDTKVRPTQEFDEAKEMLKPYMNVILF